MGMSGTPHAIKLVKRLPNDDFDGGKFALIWYSPKDDKFYVATKASDMISEYAIFTTFEDKFCITVDKNINWDGSVVADPDGDSVKNTGYVQILKFTPASTGSFTYVSPCSNRGLCNGDDAI